MATEASSTDPAATIPVGEYRLPTETDSRSPCPFINTLANHGHIPRDGKNITIGDFVSAIWKVYGLSPDFGTILAGVALTVNESFTTVPEDDDHDAHVPWFEGIKSKFGVRQSKQLDHEGHRVINLEQLRLHGAIEHDVSLTRRDIAQGDNWSLQKDLLEAFLASSSDGKYLTTEDFAKFRVQRLEMQKRDNPDLKFGVKEEGLSFGECGLIMSVLGEAFNGHRVPVSYIKALFGEERLPLEEGWKARTIPVTIPETHLLGAGVKKLAIGGTALPEKTDKS